MPTLNVDLPQNSYQIIIEKGLLNRISEEIKKVYTNKKIAIITDNNIEELYGDKIRKELEIDFQVRMIVLEPGEKSKSLEVLEGVYNELLDFQITRGDLILAFGGGVIGDLAGFAASTLLRGIPYIQIPTSLLAQIDSSVGGKVAVNLPQGKNLVGSFYQPSAVLIDPELLATLDKRYFYDGMAEVIKYACILDKELFEDLLGFTERELFENMERIIFKCCYMKKDIVVRDELDTGERMVLNFGHTLGHVIEKQYKYSKYTHGEAVAIGMYHITKNSEDMGKTKKGTANLIKKVLSKYQLPYEMPAIDREKILQTIGLDKKNKGQYINLILIKEIGQVYIEKINNKDISSYM
ncbi:MAG: 3-dehydroquinate synthase [Tissierella sp.]|nr:3-dehydroquinate synthase [Tissierella sp.]